MNNETLLRLSAILLTLFTRTDLTAQDVNNNKTDDGTAMRTASACELSPEPGFMKSWNGQTGVPDHIDRRSVNKGAWMLCLAFDAGGLSPACHVSYGKDGRYTLPSHGVMNSPSADIVTLSCKGTSPTCCKLQTAGALRLLRKKTDPKAEVIKPKDAEDKNEKP